MRLRLPWTRAAAVPAAIVKKQFYPVAMAPGGSNPLCDKGPENVARSYYRSMYLWRAVDLIGLTSSSAPLYIDTPDDRDPNADEQQVLDLLQQPNPQWNQAAMLYFAAASLAVTSKLFLLQVRGVGNRVIELWPLDPASVTVVYDAANTVIVAFIHASGGQTRRYAVGPDGDSDVIYVQRPGLNPSVPAASPAQVAVPAGEFFTRVMQRGADIVSRTANVTGVLSSETELDQGSVDAVSQKLREFQAGGVRSGDTLVLANAKWAFTRMSEDPSAVLSAEVKDSLARDVVAMFGVPPQLVGIPGRDTYDNYQTARLSFLTETLLPGYLKPVCAALTRALLPESDSDLEPDLDALPAMVKARLDLVEVATKATFLSTNEKRELLGYPPSDDADADLIPDVENMALARLKVEMASGGIDPATQGAPT